MQKKSEPGNGKNRNKAHFPKQDHAQKSGREERPDKQGRPGNAGGRLKQPGPGRSEEGLERNTEKGRIRDMEKRDGGNTKKGCFPKLFMLLLPFAAVGTYLFLRL